VERIHKRLIVVNGRPSHGDNVRPLSHSPPPYIYADTSYTYIIIYAMHEMILSVFIVSLILRIRAAYMHRVRNIYIYMCITRDKPWRRPPRRAVKFTDRVISGAEILILRGRRRINIMYLCIVLRVLSASF